MHFLDLQGLYVFWTAGVATGIHRLGMPESQSIEGVVLSHRKPHACANTIKWECGHDHKHR